jgi:hypothetical protein
VRHVLEGLTEIHEQVNKRGWHPEESSAPLLLDCKKRQAQVCSVVPSSKIADAVGTILFCLGCSRLSTR